MPCKKETSAQLAGPDSLPRGLALSLDREITTQQARTNQVIEVKCFLLKIPAIISLNL